MIVILHHSLKFFMPISPAINSIYLSSSDAKILQHTHFMYIIFSDMWPSFLGIPKEAKALHTHLYIMSINFFGSTIIIIIILQQQIFQMYYFALFFMLDASRCYCCFCSSLAISNCHYLYGRIIRAKGSRLWESSSSYSFTLNDIFHSDFFFIFLYTL